MSAEIDDRVRAIIIETFRLGDVGNDAELSVDSIAAWDSLGHFALIEALEAGFGIRIPGDAMVKMLSQAEIVAALHGLTTG